MGAVLGSKDRQLEPAVGLYFEAVGRMLEGSGGYAFRLSNICFEAVGSIRAAKVQIFIEIYKKQGFFHDKRHNSQHTIHLS